MSSKKFGKAAIALVSVLILLCVSAIFVTAAAEETAEYPVVQVTDVDAFLDAIGPDRVIVLAPGAYNLSKSSGYGRLGSAWYHWESTYDGYELVITDVTNMTIDGTDAFRTTVNTQPRYSNVMKFDSASGVTIRNLTAGHTEEEGYCSGGVLFFEDCSDLEVQNARLYGCGIRGVDLINCRNFHMDSSDIYECSYGAAYLYGCYNALFENSKFHDCHIYDGLFEIYGSREIAVINSEIFNNYDESWGSLISSNCRGIYLGGLDVHDNSSMALNCMVPVTVESCRFRDYAFNWEKAAPVDRDGNALTEWDVRNMSMRRVTWEAQPIEEVKAPEKNADGKIHVTNVDEFLAAIASDTVIYLEPGEYALPEATAYGSLGGEHYYWYTSYDGPELVINGVTDLTIEGAGVDQVSILTTPRYANVLRFDDVSGVSIRNLTAGHSEAPSECAGGVIALNYARDTRIEGCSLFGCGILGISADYCQGLIVKNTEIHDCSNGAARFFSSEGVIMEDCDVHHNGMPTYYADNLSSVRIDGMLLMGDRLQPIGGNAASQPDGDAERTEVHVTNVDEFLAAIAPNTTIYLEPGIYDLSAAADYGQPGTAFYNWEEVYDGYELVIREAHGLTIEAPGKDQVSILTTPRYANVLRLEGMNNVALRGFTAGHSKAPGSCTGGVIYLNEMDHVSIEECGLFGCGILGVEGLNCFGIRLADTEIYECSYGAVSLTGCANIAADRCDIHDNGGDDFYFYSGCWDILIDGVPVEF